MTPHVSAIGGFGFSYPGGWLLRDTDGTVSLWKTAQGGAITISAVVNDDLGRAANALEYCTRFAEKTGLDGAQVTGDATASEARFDTEDGQWCRARILARGPRLVLAIYNTRSENAAEEDQVDAIFASLELIGL